MWNAASTSARRGTYSFIGSALALVALVVVASGGASPSPRPPTDLAIAKATEDSLSLTWTAARAKGDHAVVGYHVYLDGKSQTTKSGDDVVPDTSYNFESLQCGTTYSLGVEAVDDSGQTSDVGSVMASTSPCPTATPVPAPAPAPSPAPAAPSADQQADASSTGASVSPAVAAPAATGALSFTASADARVDESMPTTNFGSREVLRVDGGSGTTQESYLRFDVSGLSGPATSATLLVYATSRTADGPAVFPTTNTWSETAMTWSNHPTLGGAVADVGPIAADTWVQWDVTKLVSGNGTYSFALAGPSLDGVAFSSREGGAAPQLVVSTDGTSSTQGSAGDTTAPTPPGGLALVSRTASSLTVSWNASSDAVGVTGYELLLNGTSTGQTTTSLGVTLSGLSCAKAYTVGVRAFDAAGNRSDVSSLATATAACPSGTGGGTGSVNWYPGYYALAHASSDKLKVLNDPLTAPFTGVQFRYFWADSELAPHDYSAGFAALDADLQAVAAKSKKLLIMLQYKKNDGTPAVPADLLKGPGSWCSGSYCGQFTLGSKSLAMVWNSAVDARLKAWIGAMAAHAAASPYAASVAGIVFNETSLPGGTTDTTILRAAGYDPYAYMAGLQADMLAVTSAAPRLPVFYYHEGGFVSMDGQSVHAGQVMGDWMLQHPHTGTGTPDLKPKDPKTTSHPCAIPDYQGRIPCNPDVQAGDYATSMTDSLDQSFGYAVSSAPTGLHASFLTFSYAVGSGPNAFTFADVSRYIPTHPIPNTAVPPGW